MTQLCQRLCRFELRFAPPSAKLEENTSNALSLRVAPIQPSHPISIYQQVAHAHVAVAAKLASALAFQSYLIFNNMLTITCLNVFTGLSIKKE